MDSCSPFIDSLSIQQQRQYIVSSEGRIDSLGFQWVCVRGCQLPIQIQWMERVEKKRQFSPIALFLYLSPPQTIAILQIVIESQRGKLAPFHDRRRETHLGQSGGFGAMTIKSSGTPREWWHCVSKAIATNQPTLCALFKMSVCLSVKSLLIYYSSRSIMFN